MVAGSRLSQSDRGEKIVKGTARRGWQANNMSLTQGCIWYEKTCVDRDVERVIGLEPTTFFLGSAPEACSRVFAHSPL